MVVALTARHCVPCEGGTPPLPADEAASLATQLTGWEIAEQKKLVKTYRFRDFVEAVAFVNAIAPVAEAEGHHPDLFVAWGKVRVYLWTHVAGGLTENDFILAAKIDQVHDRPAID